MSRVPGGTGSALPSLEWTMLCAPPMHWPVLALDPSSLPSLSCCLSGGGDAHGAGGFLGEVASEGRGAAPWGMRGKHPRHSQPRAQGSWWQTWCVMTTTRWPEGPSDTGLTPCADPPQLPAVSPPCLRAAVWLPLRRDFPWEGGPWPRSAQAWPCPAALPAGGP